MRQVVLAAAALLVLAGGAVRANPLADAKAGLAAMNNGDNPTAIRLFTQALNSDRLVAADQELAYVKRAEAYLATGDSIRALADANRALDLVPGDAEAVAARDRAHDRLQTSAASASPPIANADYEAALAKYEAQKKADADAYVQQVNAHNAAVNAQDAKYQSDLAAWRDQTCKPNCPVSAPTPQAKRTVPAAAVKPAAH